MYALGIDFGTNSVRAVVIDLSSGEEIARAVEGYPSGIEGVIIEEKNPHLARQNPADYHASLKKAGKRVISEASDNPRFSPEKIKGIGVDTTGSTPLPVDDKLVPLSFHKEFRANPNAMAWLWKDHTSAAEAEEITELARKHRPHYLGKIGGVYSSEWFFSKILHLARVDRKVFEAADSFLELADYIPAVLTGKKNARQVKRSICAAGHKALYSKEWGGLPDEEFLEMLSPHFKGLRSKLYQEAYPAGEPEGILSAEWAKEWGIPPGIPVSVGAFDAHMGAVGAGIKPQTLVKIIGTSTCDMMIFPKDESLPDIPGLCGIVPDSIVPGYIGLEAGQSAVGDIFNWFVKNLVPGKYFIAAQNKGVSIHDYLSHLASSLKPGETGLLALDWHNGNRTILVDQRLSGLLVGLTLNSKAEEIYRSLIEATAFGARVIVERLEEYGIKVKNIIATGGIPYKNPLLMQLYADILGRSIYLSRAAQTCALGAAIFGAVAGGYFQNVEEAIRKLCKLREETYYPNPENTEIYNILYSLYVPLHNMFGLGGEKLYPVMKKLLKLKEGSHG